MKLGMKVWCVFIVAIATYSCTVTPIDKPSVITEPGFEGICFETQILPLLISKCGSPGCHNSIDREDGIDFTSYDEILKEVTPGDIGDSELVEVLYETGDDIMPPAPLDPLKVEQIALIEEWISDGAKYTVNCNQTACDLTGDISFVNQVIPIIDTYCLGCHSTADPQGGYAYTTYDETMKSVNDGTLVGSIKFESGFVVMPLNSSKMPTCNIDIITLWVEQGAKDN